MLNFYGRKSPRRVKKKDVLGLFNNSFFFHHENINTFNKLHLDHLKLKFRNWFWFR